MVKSLKELEVLADRLHEKRQKSPGPIGLGMHQECMEWTSEASLLPRILRWSDVGFWCRYVGVPNNHPWHGKFYDALGDVDVNGGLTYARSSSTDTFWWLGFDCGHACDLEVGGRPEAFARAEVEKLAKQAMKAWPS